MRSESASQTRAATLDAMPTHAVALSNNKGGSGKTFMAFQIACEAARARPASKVCVVDFSLYSDVSALMLGGSAREGIGAPMRGLQTCVDITEADNRAEGLVRALEVAARARGEGDGARGGEDVGRAGGKSVFGTWFSRAGSSAQLKREPRTDVDLTDFMIRPHDVNEEVPKNLYLVAGAGTVSWNSETTAMATDDETEIPLWARTGDEWVGAGEVFRDAVQALPEAFDAIFVDTDHLAACVLTKLAFAAMDSIVIPLSYNDMDFNRLFADITGNGLFTRCFAHDGRARAAPSAREEVYVYARREYGERSAQVPGRHRLAVHSDENIDGADGRYGEANLERVRSAAVQGVICKLGRSRSRGRERRAVLHD